MQRRSFLSAVLAAAAAPAVVRASSIMPVYAPRDSGVLAPVYVDEAEYIYTGKEDFTVMTWVYADRMYSVSQVRKEGVLTAYVDGEPVIVPPGRQDELLGIDVILKAAGYA